MQHYGVELGKKKKGEETVVVEEKKKSKHVEAKLKHRQEKRELATKINEMFNSGRLLACVSSRPGQSGRCDGYVLEGKELEFYLKKMDKRKKN